MASVATLTCSSSIVRIDTKNETLIAHGVWRDGVTGTDGIIGIGIGGSTGFGRTALSAAAQASASATAVAAAATAAAGRSRRGCCGVQREGRDHGAHRGWWLVAVGSRSTPLVPVPLRSGWRPRAAAAVELPATVRYLGEAPGPTLQPACVCVLGPEAALPWRPMLDTPPGWTPVERCSAGTPP
jgi:hypothetical protein